MRTGRLTAARILLAFLVLHALAATTARAAERETSYVYPPFKHTLGMNRVGQMEMKLFLGPTARLVNPQGLAAVKLTSRDDPKTERDDDELSLLGVNSGLGQIIYNPTLYSVRSYGKVGSGEGEFLRPRGIAVDREGRVVVADTGNRRLVLLELGEEELHWRGSVEVADRAFSPTDVAIAAGLIWCCDFAGDRILRFDLDGEFKDEWPLAEGADSLSGPLALAVQGDKDDWNRTRRFSLLVVDREGQRVQIFDKNGSRRASSDLPSLISSPGRFGYPVIDLHGQVILPDSVQGRLVKLDPRLEPLAVVVHIDDDEDTLRHPNSLALYRRFGQLFIVESAGGTYAWTGTDVTDARLFRDPEGKRPGFRLEYRLTEPSMVALLTVTAQGEELLLRERRKPAGRVRDWVLPPGDLPPDAALLIRARPTYSARKRLTVERRLDFPQAAEEETP